MTKISLQYNKNDFDHYILNYKNSLTNTINSTAFELVGSCQLYTNECENTKIGRIQFNNLKIRNNTKQTYSVSENIFIEFADCENSSIFAINYYDSNTNDGHYIPNTEYKLKIISGTGSYLKSNGYITINAEENKRHVTIKLE
jgi:hypothetical protein